MPCRIMSLVVNSSGSKLSFCYKICIIPLLFLIILKNGKIIHCSPEQPDITFPALYKWGKEAYTNERWYECVAFMKRALEDYEYYNQVLLHCQKKCKRLTILDPFPLNDEQIGAKILPEIRFLEKIVQKSLCLSRCTDERLGDRPPNRDDKVNVEFENMQPYSYMQICYWKLGDLELAVRSAYTYVIKNPNDTMMINNLNFYQNQPGFSTKMLKNAQEFAHESLYEKAVNDYEDEDYENAVINFELTLESYLKSYENCQLICVKVTPGNENKTSPILDVYSAITDYLHNDMLSCRSKCVTRLTTIKSIRINDFVPHIFNHLQFAYWKTKKLRKTCEAVATYLLFSPNDQTMLENKRFYLQQLNNVKEQDFFQPRQDIKEYVERYVLDLKLLAYIDEKFKYFNGNYEYTPEHPDDYNELSVEIDESFTKMLKKYEQVDYLHSVKKSEKDNADYKENLEREKQQRYKKMNDENDYDRSKDDIWARKSSENVKTKTWNNNNGDDGAKGDGYSGTTALIENGFYAPPKDVLNSFRDLYGINVIQKERDLNGSFRFVAENLLSQHECQEFMKLKYLSELGSGYAGKGSPHTKHENFYGLTIGGLVDLAYQSKISVNVAKLFYDKTELARNFVEKYFNLTSHLYIDYTHFVCRTHKPGSGNSNRNDLSHPIHGDNCMFKDGRCDKRFPAFTWRDFSAIIYLNENFEGGEFIFADAEENEAASIKPSCGHMVSFSGNTLHGVKAVTKGTRCAMALWMTLDPAHQELERLQAEKKLSAIINRI